jgi:hypothetical protein
MFRNIKIKTAAQEITIKALDSLTLEEILRINRIPTNLFQGYVIDEKNHLKPIPLNIRPTDLSDNNEIILQCIRNTDLRQVLPQKTFYKKADNPITALRDLNFNEKECTETVHELNADSAREIVESKVSEFIKKHSDATKIIAGISGGGDSNTLVRSLKKALEDNGSEKKIICFTLVFDPIWPDSAAKRAIELCKENNVQHFVYKNKDIENLLKMRGSLEDFYVEFGQNFGNNTSHFFATYLISLIARKLCRKHGTNEYCLGFNREDVLAELTFSLMNGHKPLEFPVRKFGDIKLLMPLWEIPKIVLDACYPKYSIENYQERLDTTTFQRGIVYYLAHSIDDIYSNFGLSLMHGVQKIFKDNWSELKQDKDWDLYISKYAEPTKVNEVKKLLWKYLNFLATKNYDA